MINDDVKLDPEQEPSLQFTATQPPGPVYLQVPLLEGAPAEVQLINALATCVQILKGDFGSANPLSQKEIARATAYVAEMYQVG